MTSEKGKHAPRTSTKQPDTNKSSGLRKQWTRLEKIIWPVAPDGYIPNSVVRSLAPYPQFKHSCANRGLQTKEQIEEDVSAEQKRLLKYFLEKYGSKEEQQNEKDDKITLEHAIQSVPEETKTEARLTPRRRAVPKKEQKNEEDGEKDQSLCEKSNAFSAKQPKKVKKRQEASLKLTEAVSVSPKLQEEKVKLHQEMVSAIKEQDKSDSTNKNVHVLEIRAPKQTMRKKADSPLKKLKSFVSPLPLGDRKPNSVLIYLYKRSKAELAHKEVKRTPKVA
ncbi:hypothetical protein Q8A67_010403 [Cirrhinus molitorella]|uniref:Uncharacterized protein n=1 Tax=Cirrhinus molitorella TaxID=172907 RepID=A0AA88PPR1_9TELE|nr:hypothetical protein Q8A67_010403 [Cirrhinus molitorella]